MMKKCIECGTEFDALGNTKCCSKECSRNHRSRWVKDNPEKRRESSRRWARKNPEKNREGANRWRRKHPEGNRQNVAQWNKANPEKRNQYVRASGHNRRAKSKISPMTTGLYSLVQSESNGYCPYCQQLIVKGSIDHIYPVNKGGSNLRENLVWACSSCNSKKNDLTLIEFIPRLKEIQAQAAR